MAHVKPMLCNIFPEIKLTATLLVLCMALKICFCAQTQAQVHHRACFLAMLRDFYDSLTAVCFISSFIFITLCGYFF